MPSVGNIGGLWGISGRIVLYVIQRNGIGYDDSLSGSCRCGNASSPSPFDRRSRLGLGSTLFAKCSNLPHNQDRDQDGDERCKDQ